MSIRSRCEARRAALVRALLAGLSFAGAEIAAAQGVRVGDAELVPSVRVDYVRDSNVGLRDDGVTEGDAVVISPQVDLVAERRQLRLVAGYRGAYSASDEQALEYVDHRLSAELEAGFGARRRGSVSLELARSHEPLGLDLTRGLGDVLEETLDYNTAQLLTRFVYGATDARGNIAAGLDLERRSYTSLTALFEEQNFTSVEPYVSFGYRVSSDTRAVVELRFASETFENSINDRDELRALAGADFTATGKLQGRVRVGASNASFARDGVDDQSAFVTSAQIRWLPREFAQLSLALEREFDNTTSTRVGQDQTIRTVARVGWEHAWSTRFSTDAFAQLDDVARACPDVATSTVAASVEFNLAVRRWLSVGAGVSRAGRTADSCPERDDGGLDYERTLYGIHVSASL